MKVFALFKNDGRKAYQFPHSFHQSVSQAMHTVTMNEMANFDVIPVELSKQSIVNLLNGHAQSVKISVDEAKVIYFKEKEIGYDNT